MTTIGNPGPIDGSGGGVGGTPHIRPDLVLPTGLFGKPVCRLGLATRGGANLACEDVLHAIERGVNFLNGPGEADAPGGADALSAAVASLGPARRSVAVCVQFG